ncbi:MAG: response regulator, partial [Methylococcales bacterium]|nr:response regulator [Methylococcales bacterium]
ILWPKIPGLLSLPSTEQLLREIESRQQAQKSLEQVNCELLIAKESAELSANAKTTFLANMSHEIRTPLTAILGYSSLLMKDPSILPKQYRDIETISHSGEHLLTLLNDILDLAKLESGSLTVTRTAFNVHALLTEMERMLWVRADEKKIRLSFDVADLPTDPYIETDEGKLRQILTNLLGNAIKFTDQGGEVAIFPKLYSQENAGYILSVEVQDTGKGIEKENLERIFDRFEQTTMGASASGGSGLGLTISRNLAQLMNGNLTATSTLGKGSIFRLELPVRHSGKVDSAAFDTTKKQIISAKSQFPSYRILIVDDLAINRNVIHRTIQPLGFELLEAIDGEDALKKFHSWQPDLVLMDMVMPNMSGLQASQQIRASEAGRKTPIIAISASVLPETKKEFLDIQYTDFVSKPFYPDKLLEVIGKHLHLNFSYEGDLPVIDANSGSDYLIQEALVSCSEAWRSKMASAAQALHKQHILEIIKEIESDHPLLAAELCKLVQGYQFEKIQQLFDKENK